MKLSIKNYTTSIKIEKTINEIEQCLAQNGASSIFKMYDSEGLPMALAFQIIIDGKEIAFKLPMKAEKILIVLEKSNIQNRYKNIEQARRTGWRIIKDWVESQIALYQINLVKFEEIFLPYMYNLKTNKTLFEQLERNNFNLQLEN